MEYTGKARCNLCQSVGWYHIWNNGADGGLHNDAGDHICAGYSKDYTSVGNDTPTDYKIWSATHNDFIFVSILKETILDFQI